MVLTRLLFLVKWSLSSLVELVARPHGWRGARGRTIRSLASPVGRLVTTVARRSGAEVRAALDRFSLDGFSLDGMAAERSRVASDRPDTSFFGFL
jgi:hypothetical protein